MAPAGDGKKYAFDPKAYAKALMHACKHSSEAVTGFLIGSTSSSGKALKIVDAIPLFHTHSLAPMLKVASMLIEQHCKTVGGLEIVGMYHASTLGSLDIAPVKAIADKIASNFPGACVWAFDPSKLADRQFALSGMVNVKEEWKPIAADCVSLSEEAVKRTSVLISELKYLEIVDFDDHLTDGSLSWMNEKLFKGDALADMALVGGD